MTNNEISYATLLNDLQLNQAAELVDSVRPLRTHPSRRERLLRAPFKVAAINCMDEVIGIAAIKTVDNSAGEAGFLTVRSDSRRQGIATKLTEIRIEHAKTMGLHLLYANTRTTNVFSHAILRRSGYEYYGDFVSKFGSGKLISWYYLLLCEDCEPHSIMQSVVGK